MQLVLSLFPGIGMLDRAFEEAGFCVVRGPDVLWGGDVKTFHPPAGRFEGVIGGPPCKAFTRLRHIIEANGYELAEDLIPEFARVVEEAEPWWFLMENVPDAPSPSVDAYRIETADLVDAWVGGATSRLRRFHFGTQDGRRLDIATLALHCPNPHRAVTCDARDGHVAIGGSGKRKRGLGGELPRTGNSTPLETMLERSGLPADFFGDDSPFTSAGKRLMIGNGVPLAMGRAIADAVVRAAGCDCQGPTEGTMRRISNDCPLHG